jgi:hypothetical protein
MLANLLHNKRNRRLEYRFEAHETVQFIQTKALTVEGNLQEKRTSRNYSNKVTLTVRAHFYKGKGKVKLLLYFFLLSSTP